MPDASIPPPPPPGYQPQAPQTGMSTAGKFAIGCAIAFGVVLVLAIMAAIAIPLVLNQREQAYISQIETRLKNAAIAEEAYFATQGEYTTSVESLEERGYQPIDDVSITVERASDERYCLEGRHDEIADEVWSYDSLRGDSRKGPCV